MRTLVFAATCAFALSTAFAADVVVNEGDAPFVLQSGSYDSVFVNGSCSIPDDAVVTCTSLMVASGDVQNVVFNIGNRARLTVTGESKTFVGYDNGGCTFTLGTNAVMTVAKKFLARYRRTETRVSSYMVTINLKKDSQITASGSDSVFGLGSENVYPTSSATTPEGKKSSTLDVTTVVNLDEGSEVFFSCVRAKSRPHVRINFNGGRIRNRYNTSLVAMVCNETEYSPSRDSGTKLYLTSVNGNPIRLYKANHANYFFYQKDNGNMVIEGNLELDGIADEKSGTTVFANGLTYGTRTRILFNQTSGLLTDTVYFKGSVCPKFLATATFPMTAKLVVDQNAKVDLNGFSHTVAGLSGEGTVVNSGATATLTVDNSDASTVGKIGAHVMLVKKGTGSLAVGSVNNETTSIDVQAGSLSVANTGAFGTLSIDASAAMADLGVLGANAVGTLALANYTMQGTLSKLPIAYGTIADKSKLAQWEVVLNGESYTELPLSAYENYLWFGKHGLIAIIR